MSMGANLPPLLNEDREVAARVPSRFTCGDIDGHGLSLPIQ
jgi:hypothetical protein